MSVSKERKDKKIMNKHTILAFASLAFLLSSGCTNTDTLSNLEPQPAASPVADYGKKLEILERLQYQDSTLNRMTEILTIAWPTLFQQQSEAELWNAYFSLTWHIRPDEQEKVRKELSTVHRELQSYLELQQEGILPAKSVQVKSLAAKRNAEDDGYLVTADYLLTLRDGSTKEIQVELNADDYFMESFNPRFFTVYTGETLPEPRNEQEELRRNFIMKALDYYIVLKMTYEETLEMIDMKPDQMSVLE
ncbi:hypothetical protein NDK47_27420 [Brevibacillus ruminantium]|uniref:Uncharacterized protein n=1 Tax=Brevibacillus ruminantium TaxID=2950604 RepID=A0ABY4WI10_9BACL|nr:hypothetical protein [Brevibacillus ruminantium]USG65783.1 hypothetical protein NDK47_27420 [Brevibacillus ruminantium]